MSLRGIAFFELKSVEGSMAWNWLFGCTCLLLTCLHLMKVCFELNNIEPAFIVYDSVSYTRFGKSLCTNFKL